METLPNRALFCQDLRDVGCDEHLIQMVLTAQDADRPLDALRLLRTHRRRLLEQVHRTERSISRLDHLTWELEHSSETNHTGGY